MSIQNLKNRLNNNGESSSFITSFLIPDTNDNGYIATLATVGTSDHFYD